MRGYLELYAGGVSGYNSSQECLKLLRDGLGLKPDLVISYSGVNDYLARKYEKGHPYVLSYMNDLINEALKSTHYSENHVRLTHLVAGVEDNRSKACVWMENERKMHGLCREFGIPFLGYLQPHNYDDDEVYSFYGEVETDLRKKEYEWLINISHIFDNDKTVYMDGCHVYERGNRIIAKCMLPDIMKAFKAAKKNGRGA